MRPVYVVIVAGGSGSRMQSATPKQFLPLAGKPVLWHTVSAFQNALPDASLIVVLPEDTDKALFQFLKEPPFAGGVTLVSGGSTRFHSVQNGLQSVPSDAIVLVHDGVRPLVSRELIERCLRFATEQGAAIPALPLTDSLCRVDNGRYTVVDRSTLFAVQTPQAFKASVLLPAFEQQYRASFTDEASVASAMGGAVLLVEGEKRNIKITTPEDLMLANAILQADGMTPL